MTALQSAIKDAKRRIKDHSLLGVRGNACVVVRMKINIFTPEPSFIETVRKHDKQEWFRVLIYFCPGGTPHVAEIYLSYPGGELAVRQPITDRPGLMKLCLVYENELKYAGLVEYLVKGLGLIGRVRADEVVVKTPEYREFVARWPVRPVRWEIQLPTLEDEED